MEACHTEGETEEASGRRSGAIGQGGDSGNEVTGRRGDGATGGGPGGTSAAKQAATSTGPLYREVAKDQAHIERSRAAHVPEGLVSNCLATMWKRGGAERPDDAKA